MERRRTRYVRLQDERLLPCKWIALPIFLAVRRTSDEGSGETYIFSRLPFSHFGLNQFRWGET
jgi:hypothetical protein